MCVEDVRVKSPLFIVPVCAKSEAFKVKLRPTRTQHCAYFILNGILNIALFVFRVSATKYDTALDSRISISRLANQACAVTGIHFISLWQNGVDKLVTKILLPTFKIILRIK